MNESQKTILPGNDAKWMGEWIKVWVMRNLPESMHASFFALPLSARFAWLACFGHLTEDYKLRDCTLKLAKEYDEREVY